MKKNVTHLVAYAQRPKDYIKEEVVGKWASSDKKNCCRQQGSSTRGVSPRAEFWLLAPAHSTVTGARIFRSQARKEGEKVERVVGVVHKCTDTHTHTRKTHA